MEIGSSYEVGYASGRRDGRRLGFWIGVASVSSLNYAIWLLWRLLMGR